ncbi:MAG TPA: transposase family protein [Caldisericia bacterium]|nr:transposase family protein [Caldisericia bacterium]
MKLTMNERKKIAKIMAERYRKATKKEKGKILDEFIALTNYHRTYASYLLSSHKKKRIRSNKNPQTIFEADITKKMKRTREKYYDIDVFKALKKVWVIENCICGKRLAPFMKEIVPILESYKEIELKEEVRGKLLRVSASTIDRLLKFERKRWKRRKKSHTKPGMLLKSQIPIRTFADWNENKPGFVEIDLVAHDGGIARGDYAQTLDVTDVCTCWTETEASKNKAQVNVFNALNSIIKRFPFPILGIDSDNGGEFINDELFRYCSENKITFTRGRRYKKNDNCYVEQKNYSIVREFVGYMRYDTEEELIMLNKLYSILRLYTNYFQPVMKLIKKKRFGAHEKRTYDTARTPYRRTLESPFISSANKRLLQASYNSLNPAQLKREIERYQNKLRQLQINKNQRNKNISISKESDIMEVLEANV